MQERQGPRQEVQLPQTAEQTQVSNAGLKWPVITLVLLPVEYNRGKGGFASRVSTHTRSARLMPVEHKGEKGGCIKGQHSDQICQTQQVRQELNMPQCRRR